MEIEVGEYVRTKNGYIAKLMQIQKSEDLHTRYIFDGFISDDIYEGESYLDITKHETLIKYEFKNIIKHSKNIIDLIEVGDYVNGYKVIGVTLDTAPSGKCVDIDCDKPSYESYLFEEQIYSIVTKEQFASMEYKVEEEQKQ